MQTISIPPDQIDNESREYLPKIRELGAKNLGGVYFQGNRVATWFGLLTGTAMMVMAVMMFFSRSNLMTAPSISFWLVGLFALGCLFLESGVHTLITRWKNPGHLGDFTYVDPLHWWEVTAHSVDVMPVSWVEDVNAIEHLRDGSYQLAAISGKYAKHPASSRRADDHQLLL